MLIRPYIIHGVLCSLVISMLVSSSLLVQADDPLDNWAVQTSGTSSTFYGVAYGNGVFVAVGSGGMIRISSDGTNWAAQSSGVTFALRGVSFANGRFFAVGGYGPFPNQVNNYIISSTDGTNWATVYAKSSYANYPFPNLYSVTWGNGVYVAVGDISQATSEPLIVTSTDGVHWADQNAGINPVLATSMYGVAFGNGRFYAAGYGGMVIYSDNGTNWNIAQGEGAIQIRNCIIFGAGSFITAGNAVNYYNGYAAGYIFGPGGADGGIVGGYTNTLAGVAFGNKTFTAVGSGGFVLTGTTNLQTWIDRPRFTTNNLNAVTYGNGTFVAVGSRGTILQSANTVPPNISLFNYVSGTGAQLTISSLPGAVFTLEKSPDLVNWSSVSDFTNVTGLLMTLDPETAVETQGFYRIKPPQP